MSCDQTSIRTLLEAHRVVPVVSLRDPTVALHLGEALLEEGLPLLEVTLRTPEALGIIEQLRRRFPTLAVAAGTVCTPAALREVHDLGVAFAVSPGCTPELLSAASEVDTPLLPGAATPSEVMRVLSEGWNLLKIFPVTPLGGVPWVRALGGLFQEASFCPTGGVSGELLGEYLRVPGVMGVGGSWMCSGELLAAKEWGAVRARIRETVEWVRSRQEASRWVG